MLPLLFAAVAILALAPVLLPLLRGRRDVAARGMFDRAVYRDQLHELDRDVARGLITEAEAAGARLEIQRRLLAAGADDAAAEHARVRAAVGSAAPDIAATPVAAPAAVSSAGRPSRSPVLATVLALLVAGGAAGLYLRLGAPNIPDVPYAERPHAAAASGHDDLRAAAAGLAAKLAQDPKDARGWLLYAHTEAMLSGWDKAADAFQHAILLGQTGAEVQSGYGEMLVMEARGVVTPTARDAFDAAVKSDPGNDVARYYLALADGQAGETRKAIDGWQALAADLPSDSRMRDEIGKRIREAAIRGGLPVPVLAAGKPAEAAVEPSGQLQAGPGNGEPRTGGSRTDGPGAGEPGPSAQEMAAAAQMPEADRKAMISGMVARLAARLSANPADLDGWMRLGRAYTVLGERDKAVDAYDHAVTLKPDDPQIKLIAVETMLSGLQPSDPFPPHAIALLHQVQLVSPEEPTVLWYLGLQAARDRHPAEARDYWTRLLAKLPAGKDANMVKAALDQVKEQ